MCTVLPPRFNFLTVFYDVGVMVSILLAAIIIIPVNKSRDPDIILHWTHVCKI